MTLASLSSSVSAQLSLESLQSIIGLLDPTTNDDFRRLSSSVRAALPRPQDAQWQVILQEAQAMEPSSDTTLLFNAFLGISVSVTSSETVFGLQTAVLAWAMRHRVPVGTVELQRLLGVPRAVALALQRMDGVDGEADIDGMSEEKDGETVGQLLRTVLGDIAEFAQSDTLSLYHDALPVAINSLVSLISPATGSSKDLDEATFDALASTLAAVAARKHGSAADVASTLYSHLVPVAALTTMRILPSALNAEQRATHRFVRSFVVTGFTERCEVRTHEDAVQVFLQHVCARTPDKAPYRSAAASLVCDVGKRLSDTQQDRFCQFLRRLSQNSRQSLRAMALEVSESWLHGPVSADAHNSLVAALVHLVTDRVGSHRYRAAAALTTLGSATATTSHARELLVDARPSLLALTVDSQVLVRRHSLLAVTAWACAGGEPFLAAVDARLPRLCLSLAQSDSAAGVRKAALTSVSRLLHHFPTNEDVVRSWAHTVATLTSDDDRPVSLAALAELEDRVFRPLVAGDEQPPTYWNAVGHLMAPYPIPFFRTALAKRADNAAAGSDAVDGMILEALQECATQQRYALRLLAELVPHVTSAEETAGAGVWAADRWLDGSTLRGASDRVQVLRILSAACSRLPEEQLVELRESLVAMLTARTACDAAVVSEAIQALAAASTSPATEWSKPLLAHVERTLLQPPAPGTAPKALAAQAAAALHTLTAVIRASGVPIVRDEAGDLITAVFALMRPRLSADAVLAAAWPGQTTPATVRALAVTTVSALAELSPAMAERAAVAFAEELRIAALTAGGADRLLALRNNAMLGLADISRVFPALSHATWPALTACLRDPAELVRRQAAGVIGRLLGDELLKWRPALLHRFSVALADPSRSVVASSSAVLDAVLAEDGRANFFARHFVDVFFWLNNLESDSATAALPEPGSFHAKLFAMGGTRLAEGRMRVYRHYVSRMSGGERFAAVNRLVNGVLRGMASGTLPWSPAHQHMLGDALQVLSLDELRLTESAAAAATAATAAAAAATADDAADHSRVLASVVRKKLLESAIPVVVALKGQLERRHSPLQPLLLSFMVTLFRADRTGVQTVLSVMNRRVASEIEYDVRKHDEKMVHEEAKREEKEAAAQEAAAAAAEAAAAAAALPVAPATPGGTRALLASPRAASATSARPLPSPATPMSSKKRRRASGASVDVDPLIIIDFDDVDVAPSPTLKRRLAASTLGDSAENDDNAGGDAGMRDEDEERAAMPAPRRRIVTRRAATDGNQPALLGARRAQPAM
jgi:hypothetical protein